MKVIELKTLGTEPLKLQARFEKKEITEQQVAELVRKELWVDYKEMMIRALSNPQGQSREINLSDMRIALRIMDKVEAANGRVHLEDADYQFLNTRVQAMSWTLAHHHIMQFTDDIAGAKEVKIDDSGDKVTPLKPKKD